MGKPSNKKNQQSNQLQKNFSRKNVNNHFLQNQSQANLPSKRPQTIRERCFKVREFANLIHGSADGWDTTVNFQKDELQLSYRYLKHIDSIIERRS